MKSTTHQALARGLFWKDPKGFLISIKFRGASCHSRFDHFYIVDFHSAFTFPDRDLRSEGWVQIYNVKWSKRTWLEDPLIFSKWKILLDSFKLNLKADAWQVRPISFWKNMSFGTPHCKNKIIIVFEKQKRSSGSRRKLRKHLFWESVWCWQPLGTYWQWEWHTQIQI